MRRMQMLTRIQNGLVIDPANGVQEVRDLWISDERIVAESGTQPDRVIDASAHIFCKWERPKYLF